MICYLDMDGVLADFVGGLSAIHHRQNPYLEDPNYKHWNFFEKWGMAEADAYKPLNKDFWANLKKTEICDWLIAEAIARYGSKSVWFLTTPIDNTEAWEGKKEWLSRNVPAAINMHIICAKHKGGAAHPNSVLIDDKTQNGEDFVAAGGNSVIVPAQWNSQHQIASMGAHAIKAHIYHKLNSLVSEVSRFAECL